MRAPMISPIRRVRPASVRPQPVGPGDNLRGAGLMVMAMIGFTCNDVVMKFVTQDMPLYQTIALRGLMVMLGIALIAAREGGLRLYVAPGDRGPMPWRIVGEVASALLFLNALLHMEIADLSAIMQALPLAVMLGAALFFGETLGWRRILAVGVALIGVLMILRPGGDSFGIWSLMGVGAMLTVVLRDLATRLFSRDVRSSTIAFYTAFVVMLTGAVLTPFQGWVMPTLTHIALLALSAAFLTAGYVCAVSAMRVGEISAVAPFRYTSLLAAIVLGVIVFGDWPDPWTWAGSALVVTAGIYTIWREAQLGRRS
ncbi:DMT family transporter [Paracoccus sp. (in: a-proteobacteria)]|uniref:DMT family transporter n=1 Tax=Paracoccus sp. TaxID=267 RepID=UPI0026E08378|nr:DMT family transporter [Paracoccus sp. (in: a-proteobacteria)]MDO5648818.1 DMT family transporter [Paracoccus sp. (in: a-proteobacteria)]